MFQFSGFAFLAEYIVFNYVGCPIRKSSDQIMRADPQGLSQLTTSFIASESLGIPHTPLTTFQYQYTIICIEVMYVYCFRS